MLCRKVSCLSYEAARVRSCRGTSAEQLQLHSPLQLHWVCMGSAGRTGCSDTTAYAYERDLGRRRGGGFRKEEYIYCLHSCRIEEVDDMCIQWNPSNQDP